MIYELLGLWFDDQPVRLTVYHIRAVVAYITHLLVSHIALITKVHSLYQVDNYAIYESLSVCQLHINSIIRLLSKLTNSLM